MPFTELLRNSVLESNDHRKSKLWGVIVLKFGSMPSMQGETFHFFFVQKVNIFLQLHFADTVFVIKLIF